MPGKIFGMRIRDGIPEFEPGQHALSGIWPKPGSSNVPAPPNAAARPGGAGSRAAPLPLWERTQIVLVRGSGARADGAARPPLLRFLALG